MKPIIKFSAIAAAALISSGVLSSVYAISEYSSGSVRAAAIKDCKIVHQITLDEKATAAYYEVKSLEKKLNAVQEPLAIVERRLADFGLEMEQISELAIQDNEQTLYIDKDMLKEQESVAKKISDLVELHQADFDAIAQYGKLIGQKADDFSDPIKDAFEDQDYDQVRVFNDGEPTLPAQCDNPDRM